jgi:hypothetical protein
MAAGGMGAGEAPRGGAWGALGSGTPPQHTWLGGITAPPCPACPAMPRAAVWPARALAWAFACALAGAAAVGSPVPMTPRIVGGREVSPPGRYPFVVSLQRASTGAHFCGGSLISSHHVLTAAHCAAVVRNAPLDVVLGRHDLSTTAGEVIRCVPAELRPLFFFFRGWLGAALSAPPPLALRVSVCVQRKPCLGAPTVQPEQLGQW